MRFDGPDQRLRLIEILDFAKAPLTYQGKDLVRRSKATAEGENETSGPLFRQVYNRLFGVSYPGEYVPPSAESGEESGLYVLSYPGVAFSFPLRHSTWSNQTDFVSLLSSSAAAPAKSMAIFQGPSWSEARSTLFTKQPLYPRSTAFSGRNKDLVPDEIEEVRIYGGGRLELMRRSSPPVEIILSQTRPQDLVADLGPPDAVYRKHDNRILIHGTNAAERPRDSSPSPMGRAHSRDTDGSSAHSFTDGSDTEPPVSTANDRSIVNPECFYNYFHHGLDAFISWPSVRSASIPGDTVDEHTSTSVNQLTVTKILLHANVPGSYPFNRHRRSRWKIFPDSKTPSPDALTSEMSFYNISGELKDLWRGFYANEEEQKSMQRGMVLNRGWSESPESSVELLGGWEDSAAPLKQSPSKEAEGVQGLGNTELFGFPGLLFEVLKNDTISCLTVY